MEALIAQTEIDLVSTQIAQNLRDAANYIDEYGWTKSQYGNQYIGFCAMGAIYNTSPNVDVREDTMWLLRLYLGSTVPSWNDKRFQSARKVKKTLRKVADFAASTTSKW